MKFSYDLIKRPGKKGKKKKDNLSRIPSGKLSGTPAHICVYGLSKHYIELI